MTDLIRATQPDDLPERLTPRAALAAMFSLTDRQCAVLLAIMQYRDQHGYSPTIRELCGIMGVSSPNGVHETIVALERKQALTRHDGSARSLVPRVEVVRVTRPSDS